MSDMLTSNITVEAISKAAGGRRPEAISTDIRRGVAPDPPENIDETARLDIRMTVLTLAGGWYPLFG